MKPEFKLSDPSRIILVRDSLVIWMKNNNFEIYEIRRAMAMLLREDEENRIAKRMKGEH